MRQIGAALPPHGMRARYSHRSQPCRCELCRAANAAYFREQYRPEHRTTVEHSEPSCPLCSTVGALSARRCSGRCLNERCRVVSYSTRGRK